MIKASRLSVWFALALVVLLASSAFAQKNQYGKIIGIVRVSRGDFPDPPVLVSLEMRGSVINSSYSDPQGRYSFSGLLANSYTVKVNDPSYEAFSQIADVNPETAPMNYVQITLIRRPDARKESLPGRVEGSNPFLVDPAEYNRQFPKKTLREFEKGVEADHDADASGAIKHYEKALNYSPDFYPAHNNLGAIYVSRQDFEAAKNQFEAALKANQNDAQAYFNLSNVYLLTQHFEEAQREVDEGLKRRPDSAFGRFLAGSIYTHTGHAELAEKSLLAALQLDPKMSQAYLQLVNLYVQQKRTGDAVLQLETYLESFPDSPFAPKARELLKRLQPATPEPAK